MLVLSRKVDEAILLDDGQIRITVLAMTGGRVKLGIEAPREVSIEREFMRPATLADRGPASTWTSSAVPGNASPTISASAS